MDRGPCLVLTQSITGLSALQSLGVFIPHLRSMTLLLAIFAVVDRYRSSVTVFPYNNQIWMTTHNIVILLKGNSGCKASNFDSALSQARQNVGRTQPRDFQLILRIYSARSKGRSLCPGVQPCVTSNVNPSAVDIARCCVVIFIP